MLAAQITIGLLGLHESHFTVSVSTGEVESRVAFPGEAKDSGTVLTADKALRIPLFPALNEEEVYELAVADFKDVSGPESAIHVHELVHLEWN